MGVHGIPGTCAPKNNVSPLKQQHLSPLVKHLLRKYNITEVQDKFLEKLNPDAYILDFGCGAGRDTKYFLSRGYQVDAIDGSEQLCRIASEYTGIKVRQMLFQELDEKEKYDGIWACASILHLPKKQLREVLENMYV